MDGAQAEVPRAGSGEARVVSVLVSLLGLGLVDNQILSPLLFDIATSLGTHEASVGRTVIGYAVAAALAALIVGPMSDRFGRRRFLIAAAALFSVASALVVTVDTFSAFVAARALTGAAAGVISALTVAAIADAVPYERRGRAMGFVATAYFAAPILGVRVATEIAERLSWQANYAVFAVVALLGMVAVALWFEEARPASASPDGAASLSRGYRNYLVFFDSRSTAAGAVSAFFVTGGLTGFLLFLGAYLRIHVGLSLTSVGNVFVLSGMFSLVGALGAGWFSDRLGKLRVAIAGNVALALFLVVVPETVGGLLYVTLGLIGFAAAARVAPLQSLVTQLVSQEQRGAYVALRNTLSQAGSATAAAASASLYDHGFQYICWMTAGFTVLALVLLLLIDEPVAEVAA